MTNKTELEEKTDELVREIEKITGSLYEIGMQSSNSI